MISRRQEMLDPSQRRDVLAIPFQKSALRQHTRAFKPSLPTGIGPDEIACMLPIVDARLSIISNAPPGARYQNIGPPVVAWNICFGAALNQKPARRAVHDHRIAAADALYQRVREGRRAREKRRISGRHTRFIHRMRSRTVKRRKTGWLLLQPSDSAFQLVGMPDVVLIRKSVIGCVNGRIAG
ncbi:hypothetical protein FHX09_001205 [Rhizobium sp. BK538]|nr:hypothetical protein [Rhizobium sp. BK538]